MGAVTTRAGRMLPVCYGLATAERGATHGRWQTGCHWGRFRGDDSDLDKGFEHKSLSTIPK